MKKILSALLLLAALALPVSAQSPQRAVRATPNISFSNATATCSVSVYGENKTDRISLTAKLYQGDACIATWTDSGTGYLNFSRSKRVQKGKSYKLTADVTVNGESFSTASDTGTCP